MAINASESVLREVSVQSIDRNPENPRLFFRPAELEELLESIRKFGVQVPISVYKKAGRYVLIDGERRWRCCIKLGKKTIPALVQEEPDSLTNLLLMFNIHSLREQWDLVTIALKLPQVVTMLENKLQHTPNEREISEHTGLPRGVIRRCKLLMELPQSHKEQILAELGKPKPAQRLTEDFFIEMEKALKTVERAIPEVIQNKERIRNTLIKKYEDGVINSRINFRLLGKIARSDKVHIPKAVAHRELLQIFTPNDYSIEQSFNRHFSTAYREHDVSATVRSLTAQLAELTSEEVDPDLKGALRELRGAIDPLIEEE